MARPPAKTGSNRSTAPAPQWPSVEQQLADAKAVHGSKLEQLIKANQDFGMLRADEANDRREIPPWLRVHWRKHHPEAVYSAADPSGGYPRILRRLHAWMLHHQDFAAAGPHVPAHVPGKAGGKHGR